MDHGNWRKYHEPNDGETRYGKLIKFGMGIIHTH